MMNTKKTLIAFFSVVFVFTALAGIAVMNSHKIAMLNPKGYVGIRELEIISTSTWLMLIVVIPVFILTFLIAWKYRMENDEAGYDPNWNHNILAEAVWWGFPLAIILFLCVIAWNSSHELDPYRPLESDVKPITIQVVALQWKWLFIYPEEQIASVNFFQFPEKTPVNFAISAEAPMNSFWIPQLGGQIYAMPGMATKLHLIADEPGSYYGSSANISGAGFAGMHFIAKASSKNDFEDWVQTVKKSSPGLDLKGYEEMVKPSEYNPVATFVLKKADLFDWIVMKPMMFGE